MISYTRCVAGFAFYREMLRAFRVEARIAVGFSALVLLSSCGTIATVLDSDEFNRRVYVGGGLLASKLEPDASDSTDYSVRESQSAGGSIFLGYDVANRLAIEGNLASLGAAEMSPAGEISYSSIGFSALVYGLNPEIDRERRTGFSLYGRIGAGLLENDSTEGVPFERLNDFHVLFGAGVEFGFKRGLGIRAEFISEDTDVQYAQLGLLYRFGGRHQQPDTRAEVTQDTTPDATQEGAAGPEDVIVATPRQKSVQPEFVAGDSDLDGVSDDFDQCLGTASGVPVNSVGCDYFEGVIEGINFETNSALLTPQATRILLDVARKLISFSDIRISIEAHTDNQGSAPGNMNLSKSRALSVARFLVSQGIAVARFRPRAYGESRPRASNANAEGRAMNRRVEFKVIQ